MGWYLAKLALLLPLLGALIWASLWLTRRLQSRLVQPGRPKAARLVETVLLSPGVRLAVVQFHDREVLLGCTRQGLTRLAEAPARADHPAAEQG